MTGGIGDKSDRSPFACVEGKVYMRELLELSCGLDGRDGGWEYARGFLSLTTNLGPAGEGDFRIEEHSIEPDRVRIVLRLSTANLCVESVWTHDAPTGVWSRKDVLRNESAEPVTVFRCLSAFPFPPARYEAYSQSSCWCNENQGRWQELSHGSLVLGCEGGRTTQGGTPYACLRDIDSQRGVIIHIVPRGNWVIRCTRRTMANSLPLLVEAGLADTDLRLSLAPGETLELPEILLQPLSAGPVESAAPALHSYLLRHNLRPDERDIPFVYNTWFDVFEKLDVSRLRNQLAAAKDIGCEVFVIDAGWYGRVGNDWCQNVGDWREATDRSFHGRMAGFAEEVRSAGLGFGVWMEPERLATGVPIVQEHPEWFIKSSSGMFYPNLEDSEAYQYTLGEISRLVKTYKLAWMKIDFNHPVGPDPSGKESSGYYAAWYRMLEKLRTRFPQTIFEGCTSGGLRTDINTVGRFPLHFLSDTIEPIDMLRITQGALLRLTPGRLGKWIGLRDVGKTIPMYGQGPADILQRVVAPGGPLWEGSRIWDPRFVAAVCLCGAPGLTGDIASLSQETRQILQDFVKFYKVHRQFIVRCMAHLLTPPRPIEDRTGWAAIQLQPPDEEESILLTWRLQDIRSSMRFPLRNLRADRTYRVSSWISTGEPPCELTGRELLETGLCVSLPHPNIAGVFLIRPAD